MTQSGTYSGFPVGVGTNPQKGRQLYIFGNFYRPQRSCNKVMFLHLSVSHSVHGGGGVWQTTPWADTPTLNPVHAGIHAPLPAATAADGTHPTGMLSCLLIIWHR